LSLTAYPVEFYCADKKIKQIAEQLYPKVCEILDMEFKGKSINILCFKTHAELVEKLSNTILPFGLYIPENETIYISLDNFTTGMLAHEIGHAIITNYSSFNISSKAQEILCGYVEYEIIKGGSK